MTTMDIHQRDDLTFPQSLPEFQQQSPDDATCATYLKRARWPNGFICPHCSVIAEPYRSRICDFCLGNVSNTGNRRNEG
jgi:hypothetical protein